jgi:hypothetical protein
MEPLRELLGSNHQQTLEFFLVGLREVSEPDVDSDELLYNASVLAHYAQVSTRAADDVPTPAHLGEVFDAYVLDTSMQQDSGMMETAGAQCLFLAGYFEDQMRRRHTIRWDAGLGARFYHRAAATERKPRKARLLSAMASHFESWRQRHAQLSRELRDRPYLLSPFRPPIM